MSGRLTEHAHGLSSSLGRTLERANEFGSIAAGLQRQSSTFSQIAEAFQNHLAAFDRIWIDQQRFFNQVESIDCALRQHREDRLLLNVELPKRGWYLTGGERCTLSDELAALIRASQMDEVDRLMIEHLPQFKEDKLDSWCRQEGIPAYCCNRIRLFLSHHEAEHFEAATYLGVPLLDEVAKYLYQGKMFTTKRSSRRSATQMKPEIAMKTAGSPELSEYCAAYLQEFGSLQLDVDHARLEDPNYWNRHAIVHGLMRRSMNDKDSAKCVMALGFLVSARKEPDTEE